MVLALGERTDNKMRPYNDLHVSPNIFYDIATKFNEPVVTQDVYSRYSNHRSRLVTETSSPH